MDCSEIERLLPVYADGEFDGSECAATELHLLECRSCRQKVDEQIAFRNFIRSHAGAVTPAPESLRLRVKRSIAQQRAIDNLRRFAAYSAIAAGLAVVATAGYVEGRAPAAQAPGAGGRRGGQARSRLALGSDPRRG